MCLLISFLITTAVGHCRVGDVIVRMAYWQKSSGCVCMMLVNICVFFSVFSSWVSRRWLKSHSNLSYSIMTRGGVGAYLLFY